MRPRPDIRKSSHNQCPKTIPPQLHDFASMVSEVGSFTPNFPAWANNSLHVPQCFNGQLNAALSLHTCFSTPVTPPLSMKAFIAFCNGAHIPGHALKQSGCLCRMSLTMPLSQESSPSPFMPTFLAWCCKAFTAQKPASPTPVRHASSDPSPSTTSAFNGPTAMETHRQSADATTRNKKTADIFNHGE